MALKGKIDSAKKLAQWASECRKFRDEQKKTILICFGTGCKASGSEAVYAKFDEILKEKKIQGVTIETIKKTGCHGRCEMGPLVVIEPEGIFYTKVKPANVKDIVEKTIEKGEVVEKLLCEDPHTKQKIEKYKDIDFYRKQTRIALRNLGHIDPKNIEDYIAVDGYAAVAKVLSTMSPEDVIEQVKISGLRGRGGGGFLTGKKWATCRRVESDTHYVICNGDEGDPGAFMDRSIMEGDPHTVLEGMIICAYAVGARDGYIYVREEYPLAVEHLFQAIDDAASAGLLGENILGTDFSFDIHISRGGGAFVCGESSALMKSVAGDVGEPRAKYIHSVVKGLHDEPTVLNNVETYANIPMIINKGADWFKSIGTPKSTGTKAFSLVGKVENTGLVEVPMGITLREIIFDIGGGIKDGRKYKAVQTGGPSGGCLPESMLDEPVDFDSLTKAGSMMGSGGMIVMDDRTCMVDVAKYFLKFLVDESCGKDVPCREGLYQLHALAVKVSEGKATEADLELMEKLSQHIITGSLCGLGKSGPNPFLSTVRYFRDEYLAHIIDKKCPAGVCRALIKYEINDKCTGCMACIKPCPVNAISGEKKKIHTIDQDLCTQCGACHAICQFDAIDII